MVFRRKNQAEQPLEAKHNSLPRKDYPEAYLEWQRLVTKKMPHLSKPQAVVLAMWSFGIAVTHCCGLSTVTVFIADLLGQKQNNIRERLRQWYKQKPIRPGRKLANLEVSTSFVPLLQWILSWWDQGEKSLVLAVDASTLGERFTVLLISVVYRGCGIPVAWKIVGATDKGSWKPHWLKLFEQLQGGIPHDWKVIVTTDRGLYAKWMYEAIQRCHWHPFMRINQQGLYQSDLPVQADQKWIPLSELIVQVGQHFVGHVTCFKSHSLSCTLLAHWDPGYTDPWLIVTDLPASEAEHCWYGMRSWIECLFKDLKRGGFGWHHTKMTNPEHAERLWLAIAVATLWYVSIGGGVDRNLSANGLSTQSQSNSNSTNLSDLSDHTPTKRASALTTDISAIYENYSGDDEDSSAVSRSAYFSPYPCADSFPFPLNPQAKWLSCFRRGFLRLLVALIKQDPLPRGSFIPDYSLATG